MEGEAWWQECEEAGDRNPKKVNVGAQLVLFFDEAQDACLWNYVTHTEARSFMVS